MLAQVTRDTSPRRARAAVTVFFRTIAIVIGPTPPGTGVMYAARSAAPGSTSPKRPVLGAVHADVDHRRAGLHHVGADHVQLPDGGDEDVGVERVPLAGRRCASGRSSPSRSPGAAGARSACRRCSSGRRRRRARPSVSISYSASMRMIPSGVPGTRLGPAEIEAAGVHRVEAVDVLRRVDRLDRLRLVDVGRQRQLDEDARRRRRRRSARRGAAGARPPACRRAAGGRSRGCRRPSRPCACR